MFLTSIHLANFRNFTKLDLDLEQTLLLLGKNAQGKTNLLEAIYFLATTKSPRAEKDLQLIKEGEKFCLVSGEIDDTKLEIGMQVGEIQRLEKKLKVNGVPRRALDYIGNLVVVHFAPEDINMVNGSPSLRRWHVDLTLAQIDKAYKSALTKYHEALTSRNRVLKRIKEGLSKVDELDFWTKQILDFGLVVSDKRKDFFEAINDDKSQFKFIYSPNLISESRLQEYLGREIAATNTLVGPHRDDFSFVLEGKNLAAFGSRGEQRTAVLELKLAELRFIEKFKDTRPILLLDDVFSELDREHQQYVIDATKNQQTIISAVENENIPEDFLQSVKIIRVEEGEILQPK